MPHTYDSDVPTPREALQRLIEGNTRFQQHKSDPAARVWDARMAERTQRPFATVLGCSDSRTPVEIIFDQGLGDLFVIRVAGNIVAPSVTGSIEFAASQFGPRLVVVLGHTNCGAIGATVRAIRTGDNPESRNIRSITDRITPHLSELIASAEGTVEEQLLREAMRANVRASADHLRHGSRILEDLVLAGRIVVVGAEYDIARGKVHFFDGVENLQ